MDELLGSRSTARPATIALYSDGKLLAAATAARARGGCGVGSSKLEIVRLWREESEPDKGRQLEVLSSVNSDDGDFYRVAWSRAGVNSTYPLGLIAGGHDDGVVTIWDPARFPWTSSVNYVNYITKDPICEADHDEALDLGMINFFNPKSSQFFTSHGKTIVNESSKTKIKNPHYWKEVAKMEREVEHLYINQSVEELPDAELSDLDTWHLLEGNSDNELDEWDLVSKDEIKEKQHDTLLSHKSRGFLLKMAHLTGPVYGLAFNNQFGNILAACNGDKLSISYIDSPIEDSTVTYEFSGDETMKNAQVTFLEWHPHYAAILASTSDIGLTAVWDIRCKKAVARTKQPDEYCSEVHWLSNDATCFVVASNNNYKSSAVKIWDVSGTGLRPKLECEFGPGKGVKTLSLSSGNEFLTTDMDGAIEWWTLNDKTSVDPHGGLRTAAAHGGLRTAAAGFEARWCDSEDAFVVSSSTRLDLYKLVH